MSAIKPQTYGDEDTLATRTRVLNVRLGPRALKRLDTEERRALAVFRAADLADDPAALDQLLEAVGENRLDVDRHSVRRLAHIFRDRGYPLTDDGIRVFKLERGFSEAVRIGPHVAGAYARFIQGREAKLNVPRAEWQEAAPELRRAVRVLMRIGRNPDRLLDVRKALGIRDAQDSGPILVGLVSGEALLNWSRTLGWKFNRDGFRQLHAAIEDRSGERDERLVGFVAESILARNEPKPDYRKIQRDEVVLNRRTVEMLSAAKRLLGEDMRLSVLRGSYLKDHDSEHPHQGGGVVDLNIRPSSEVNTAVEILRATGFAAWYRARGDRHHIHAVAIGDRDLSAGAQWQVQSFFEGRDGRTRGEEDPHGHRNTEVPEWTRKYRVRYL
ncbi:MAG: hypothetical protein AAF654_13645 [Myxococcota bacterium]